VAVFEYRGILIGTGKPVKGVPITTAPAGAAPRVKPFPVDPEVMGRIRPMQYRDADRVAERLFGS
jgi:hypothetical protein